MRRCCVCHRTFGLLPGAPAGVYSDGLCERCWPGYRSQAGLPERPYPGGLTEDRADEVTLHLGGAR